MADMKTILTKIEQLPDDMFVSVLSDPDQMKAVREQMYSPIRSKNVRTESGKMRKDEIESLFNVSLTSTPDNKYEVTDHNTDRQVIDRVLSYLKSRWDATPEKNRGALKEALYCFGQGEVTADPNGRKTYDNGNADWMNRICKSAGISSAVPTQASDKAQKKDDDGKPAPDPVQSNNNAQTKAQKRKQATANRPKQMPPIGAASQATNTQQQTANSSQSQQGQQGQAPNNAQSQGVIIGTPFLANGMQFVLYKPSEAYQKPERQAIIKNYFYAETITILYGQAGSFKTFYSIWEGVSLVLGKTLCELEIEPDTDPQKVLYISLEMSAKDISDRLTRMTKDLNSAERQQVEDNFTIISAEDTANMKACNVSFMGALEQLCTSEGYNVIYIDSWADYVAGLDVRSESEMTSALDALRTFSLKNHVSFRMIHHGTKPTQDANGSMAGIHTIRDLVDNVYLIKATDTKEITVTSDMQKDRSAKSRHGEPITLILQFVSDPDSFSFKRIQETQTTSHMEKVKRLLQIIEENPGINARELREKNGNPKDHTKVLDGLIGTSVIVDTEKSQRGKDTKRYYTVDDWMSLHPDQKP